jgi:transposase
MKKFQLSSNEWLILETALSSTQDVRQHQRAQALLWLAEGDLVVEVAERLRVERRTIYNWVTRFQERSDSTLEQRLAGAPRGGRPAIALGIIDPLLEQILDTDPRQLGFNSTIWTAALLQGYLVKEHKIEVCSKSVSLALQRIGVSWKRPRHTLALRSLTWRQAKGG